ncbi:hypothetical protein ACJOV8_015895 [Formosa sp. 3Alg 14/1]|uniref:hypothetical protein n=1 Tax=Formosa sp. 3Alg 14/1 TaxID=3382190 RepID=UPI0039BEBDAB
MKSVSHFFKAVIQACPYTLVGKTCVEAVKGKPVIPKKTSKNSLLYKKGMQTGRNIALVGVFCPFLWYSILSGGTRDFIILNAIHSGIIVCIGGVVAGINYLALNHSKHKMMQRG